MNDSLTPLYNLLAGKFGWLPAVVGWIGALRMAFKCVSGWLQARMTAMVAAVATDPDSDRAAYLAAILGSGWYKLPAFLLEFVTSIKLPTYSDFRRQQLAAGEPKTSNTMKIIGIAFAVLAASLVAGSIVIGCANHPPITVGVNADTNQNITGTISSDLTSNVTIAGNVTGNPQTGAVSGGISITFRQQPSAEAQTLLIQAGAAPVKAANALVWKLPQWNYQDTIQSKAIETALREGAVLSRM